MPAVTRLVVFTVLSGWLIYEGGWGTTPEPQGGDAPEYVFMTRALARHGTPDLRAGDAQDPGIDAKLSARPSKPMDLVSGFVSTADGKWFCWHFFFYPLLNLPMKGLTWFCGMQESRTYTLTNALFMICVIGQLLFATRYPLGLQLVGTAMFVWSSALWYFALPHTEVMTSAFVFMSLIFWFHERRYAAILLVSLAAMQNPPLFLLSLYYLLPTLIRKVPNRGLNTLLCGLASCWVVAPPLFYRYHYGVGSLIVTFGFLNSAYITLNRFIGFFFDINQGMIVAMPTALPLFLIAYVRAAIAGIRGEDQMSDRRRSYDLLLIPVLIGMTLFIMPMGNWNHGQSVVNRYATWCSMIPLAYLIQLMSYGWNSRRFVAATLLIVVPQVLVAQDCGGTRALRVHPGEGWRHKTLALFVLEHFPRLYNPDPHIFWVRTLQSPDLAFPVVVMYGKDGGIRKLAVRKGSERELLRYGWSENEIQRVANEARFVPFEVVTTQGRHVELCTYLHPGDFQDGSTQVVLAKKPKPYGPPIDRRESQDPAKYASLVDQVLPGFVTTESGAWGIGVLPSHNGRDIVLRTHPISQDKPCVLSKKVFLAADKKTQLILDVSHHVGGDWRLMVRANGQIVADEIISKQTCPNGWRTILVDLSQFAGHEVELELLNQANDWNNEFGYWGGAWIVSQSKR